MLGSFIERMVFLETPFPNALGKGWGWGFRKEAIQKMKTSNNSTAFRVLIAKICISLFSMNLASKFHQLLITAYAANTYQFQREFLFNNGIQSQKCISRLSNHPENTNFLKRLVPLPNTLGQGLGVGVTAANPARSCSP
jgi:hypothetical protein